MAAEVKISGSVFSSLLFQHSSSNTDQEGLLLGQVVSHVEDVISDSQMNTSKENTIIYVYSFIPCHGILSWYDSCGRIVQSKLKDLLQGGKYKEVVGWYKFRRDSSMRISLREHAAHGHLLEAFPSVPLNKFLFGLFTVYTTENLSTHTFEHAFMSYTGSTFRNLPVVVQNLGNTCHSSYKLHPSHIVNPKTSQFHKSAAQFQSQFQNNEGENLHVQSVQSLNEKIHSKVKALISRVQVSEQTLDTLDAEVTQLQKQYDQQELLRIKGAKQHRARPPSDIIEVRLPPELTDVPPRESSRKTSRPLPKLPSDRNAPSPPTVVDISDSESNASHIKELEEVFSAATPTDNLMDVVEAPVSEFNQSDFVLQKQDKDAANQEWQEMNNSDSSEDEVMDYIGNATVEDQSYGYSSSTTDWDETQDPNLSNQFVAVQALNPTKLHGSESSNRTNQENASAKEKKGDAFSFVSELLTEAKAPVKRKSNTSKRKDVSTDSVGTRTRASTRLAGAAKSADSSEQSSKYFHSGTKSDSSRDDDGNSSTDMELSNSPTF